MYRKLVLPILLVLTLVLAACGAPAATPAPAPAEPTTAPMPEPTEEPAAEEAEAMNIVETAIAAGSFTTLVTAVSEAGLVDALSGEGPFTVFAPTDEAFAALPEGLIAELLEDPSGDLTQILLFHVIAGAAVMSTDLSEGLEAETLQGGTLTFSLADGATVNGVNIIAVDIETSNGVIHVIDAVLVPSADEEPEAMATPEAMEEEEAMNIVETAIAAGNFTTLVTAVSEAGLVDALSGEGPFTVFAPTDEAFAALPEGLIAELLEDPSGDLTQILLFHVIGGAAVMSTDLSEGLEAETLQGGTLTFSLADGATVNGINIIAVDIETSNGVIHVIDAVLVP